MGRRFLLCGVFIIFPFQQGTIMQVAVANLTAIIYLVFQLQTMPCTLCRPRGIWLNAG